VSGSTAERQTCSFKAIQWRQGPLDISLPISARRKDGYLRPSLPSRLLHQPFGEPGNKSFVPASEDVQSPLKKNEKGKIVTFYGWKRRTLETVDTQPSSWPVRATALCA
jgi:hypothetical protein